MKRIKVDKVKCVGCRLCEVVCSDQHFHEYNPRLGRIRVPITYPLPSAPTVCMQCAKPKCVDTCPEGALEKGEERVEFYEDKCTGCGACVSACPFNAIWVSGRKKALKCDLCDGKAQCAAFCPQLALSLQG